VFVVGAGGLRHDDALFDAVSASTMRRRRRVAVHDAHGEDEALAADADVEDDERDVGPCPTTTALPRCGGGGGAKSGAGIEDGARSGLVHLGGVVTARRRSLTPASRTVRASPTS